jgi:hypothetical protein
MEQRQAMQRIQVDMNFREDYRTIVIPQSVSRETLVVGARVILYEVDDIECEAVLRHGATWDWVADIVDGTIKEISPPSD